MATIIVRDVDDQVMHRLRVRAARNSRSVEAEVRAILVEAVGGEAEPEDKEFFMALHERFAAIGGVDLELPERNSPPRIVDFD